MRRGVLAIAFLAATCGGPDHSHDPASLAVQAQSGASLTIAALGGTLQLVGVAKDSSGRVLTAASISWAGSNEVVEVSPSGLVTALKNGEADVTAALGVLHASAHVIVAQAPDTVAVTPASGVVERGATVQLAAAAVDSNGQRISDAAVSWSVADTTVATIAADGTATGVKVGSTSVTATVGAKSGSSSLAVQVPSANAVTISGISAVLTSVGATGQLMAAATDARGNPIPEAAFTWSSSDATVASVDANGLVTAKKNGTATITATSGTAHGTLDVTVAQAVSSVQVTPATDSVPPGATVDYSAAALDANLHPVAGAPAASWGSSESAHVSIDSGGHAAVSGSIASKTDFTITGTVAGIPGTATLTVDPNLLPVACIQVTGGWQGTTTNDTSGHATYVMSSGASQSISACCPFTSGGGCPF